MNRREATKVLTELIDTCSIVADAVMLMPPCADDVHSKGYQLHLKSDNHQQNISCIVAVLEKYGLSLADEPDKHLLIIYKPATPKQVML